MLKLVHNTPRSWLRNYLDKTPVPAGAPKGTGYVYVLEVTGPTSYVKVGATTQPRTRFESLGSDAHRLGSAVSRSRATLRRARLRLTAWMIQYCAFVHTLISSNQLAASSCTAPIVVLIIAVVLILVGIAGIAAGDGDPAAALGCIPIVIALVLLGWVFRTHSGGFCHL
ncbi:hypothetical protein [Streptomyces canus]|uniref:hypothetical protein n=1 Tax=Streptomyces canus TaxID=58343 RepID=UPI002DDBA762|nr:hypothetical protein [Streptomyces canus]WSD92686.1 hypothetical protein OG925_51440 [Streptomyces canus]